MLLVIKIPENLSKDKILQNQKTVPFYYFSIYVPSLLHKNSGRKKNSGINSLTSVVDS